MQTNTIQLKRKIELNENYRKKQSNKDNRDYIEEFNIKGFSQKIQVTADKTYFYNDSDLTEKSKAFLVKGDIAYLENLGEKEIQVYFDGKVILLYEVSFYPYLVAFCN